DEVMIADDAPEGHRAQIIDVGEGGDIIAEAIARHPGIHRVTQWGISASQVGAHVDLLTRHGDDYVLSLDGEELFVLLQAVERMNRLTFQAGSPYRIAQDSMRQTLQALALGQPEHLTD